MTREEAVNKLRAVSNNYGWGPDRAGYFVDALEALGLLEFTKMEDVVFKAAGEMLRGSLVDVKLDSVLGNGPRRLTEAGAYEVLDVLRKSGFKVVRE